MKRIIITLNRVRFWMVTVVLVYSTQAGIPPLDLQVVSKFRIPDQIAGPRGVLLGNLLCLNNDGLTVIDVHDPNSLSLVAHVVDEFGYVGPIISGSLLFQIGGQHLAIYDLSIPSSPVRIGVLTNFSPRAIAVSDHFLVGADNGLTTVDLSDPTRPTISGRIQVTNGGDSVVVSGRIAYTTDPSGAISVVDLADLTRPTQIGTIPGTTASRPLAVRGDSLYILNGYATTGGPSSDVEIYDISDPRNPKLKSPVLATRSLPAPEYLTLIKGGFIQSDLFGPSFSIVSEETPLVSSIAGIFSQPIGSDEVNYSTSLLAVDEHFAYIDVQGVALDGVYGSEIWVVNVATRANYLPVNQFESPRITGIDGANAFLSTFGNIYSDTASGVEADPFPPLVSIDLANPLSAMVIPTNRPTSGDFIANVNGMAIATNKAAVLVDHEYVVFYDLSTPSHPTIASSMDIGEYSPMHSSPSGAPSFSGGSNDVFFYDLYNKAIWRIGMSNITDPKVLARFDVSIAFSPGSYKGAVILNQTTLYASVGSQMLAFEIGSSTNLVPTTAISTGYNASSLTVAGEILVATAIPLDGITFYDISDAVHPKEIAVFHGNCVYSTASANGNYVYAARGDIGIDVLDISLLPAVKRVGGNSLTKVRSLFNNGRLLVTTSRTDNQSNTGGTSSIFPLFENTPAYTPFFPTASLNGFRFKLRGIPGTTAQVQRSTSLGDWADWTSITLGTNTISVLDADTTVTNRFYRVVAP